jgi:predicted Rossmann fold nucleotide-binding protein DprA/Smf involved in DNA uptake
VPEGNHQLIKIGAKPFPEEPWHSSLRTLLNSTAQADAVATDVLSTEQVEINGGVMSSEVTNGLGAESQVYSAVVLEREPQLDRVTALPSNGNHAEPKDAFEAVLSLMLSYLKEPRSEKSLAELLGVRVVQMRDWLQRATAEGMVKKTRKGYVANYEDSQLSLLS